jgi:outer membrane biosynthesis protein TonB
MDATAVDSHRRLVLIRRDDVEHLILIGGPTDVVVEQGIQLGGSRRPAPPPAPAPREQAPQPQPQSQPQKQAPRPAPPRQQQPVMRAQPAPRPQPAPAQRLAPPPSASPAPQPPRPYASTRNAYLPRDLHNATPPTADDLDRTLVSELTISLDEPAPKPAHSSIEDEMNKLLGELSAPKR